MTTNRRRTGLDLVVESLVVIFSILVAFGLDAWWDGRVQRQELLSRLSSVGEELESNVALLELEELFHRTATASIDDLVARIDAAEDDPWLTVPDTIASFAIVFPPVFDASTGALDALVAGGGLSQLRNPELVRSLGNLRAQVEDVRDGEFGARRVSIEDLTPLFLDTPDFANIIGRSGEYRRRGFENVALPSRPIRLPNVEGLRNRLLLRRAWVDSALRSIALLRTNLDTALELIRAQTQP